MQRGTSRWSAARGLLAALSLLWLMPSTAHHSYALFDTSKVVSVSGVAAKFEWINPHSFIWVYVPDKQQKSGYQLHAFESGSMVVMAREGWDRNSVRVGDKLSVDYFPLRDGRPGGSLVKITHADGRVFKGDPFGQRVIEQMKQAAKP
ncbi:MAG: DUF6152 family protein [Steroidobacteraceae bacterium]